MSHRTGASDRARARELYKYYQPQHLLALDAPPSYAPSTEPQDPSQEGTAPPDDPPPSKTSSPDTALTAFSQLVAWRLGAQHAMISLIDGETQYFIAESTKSVDLVDNSIHKPGDGLWVGCSQVSKYGRLCEKTIELPPPKDGEFAAFIINDLREDERFNQLPFVTGPPYFKFYAGTPLITKRGIPIGSLFVVDDRPRDGVSKDDIHFMGTMGRTIMSHLEMVREVEEHRLGQKMSRGLASFVEGRAQLLEADVEAEDEGTMVAGQFESGQTKLKTASTIRSRAASVVSSVSSLDRKEKEYSSAMLKTEEAIMAQSQEGAPTTTTHLHESSPRTNPPSFDGISTSISSEHPESPEKQGQSPGSDDSESSTMKTLFSRAANLIREAFEMDGGSVFYDAQKGFGNEYRQGQSAESPMSGDHSLSSEESRISSDIAGTEARDFGAGPIPFIRPGSITSTAGFSQTSTGSDRSVEILGFSTPGASSIHGDEMPGPQVFTPLDERSLQSFLKRYARGKLWTFDEDGAVSSSDDDKQRPTETLAQTNIRRDKAAAEARLLLRHFPGVRQLLFVPLWDASRSRWLSANFTWSTEPTRVLSKQAELAFLTAFGNSVMAECSRMNTEMADQKKGDFIGSISHELRSPLHGILASAEFLGEELTEGFAKGLVETIDSCGRTLLDTINHILDFSKINHFEKTWRRTRRGGSRALRSASRQGPLALRQADLPMINLFAEVDVAIICEEVVESVFAGYVFQNITAPHFDMVQDFSGKMADVKDQLITSQQTASSENQQHDSDVAVILDIDIENYHFTTQPGALRRVIMNLLGNALKYTSRGYVNIKLDATEMEDFHPAGSADAIKRSRVTLTITDTGKGISNEFLRSKLFTPFAQENSLSSGTGLGLAIVKSIVALLEGEIQIKSEVGRGTEVKVILPLLREFPKDSSGSTPRSISSIPKDVEELMVQLRTRLIGKSATLFGFDLDISDPLKYQTEQLLKGSITNFLSNWFGLRMISDSEKADIIIVDEPHVTSISTLARPRPGFKRGPVVLVLCSHSSRYDRLHSASEISNNVGYIAKPVGPLKLGRALNQILDGIPVLATPGLQGPSSTGQVLSPGTSDLSNVFEELSLSPHGGEVLDNSRMAAGSDNARKAIESPTPSTAAEKTEEFPFPEPEKPKPKTPKRKSMPGDKESLKALAPGRPVSRASAALSEMEKGKQPEVTSAPSSLPAPSLLLVDDNKINLRLLRTYMRKRHYDRIDEAENGLQAVEAVRDHEGGYDIIFMDISMPVLDGFDATRQIRQIEHERRERAKKGGTTAGTPALVIAVTGLASSRDQSEAFTSGIDLFLTKPVSFKEVGKMLDNWEANRERELGGNASGKPV